jgi:hypothetical protein
VREGLGLGLTRRRLEALYGEAHAFAIAPVPPPATGTAVTIELPWVEGAQPGGDDAADAGDETAPAAPRTTRPARIAAGLVAVWTALGLVWTWEQAMGAVVAGRPFAPMLGTWLHSNLGLAWLWALLTPAVAGLAVLLHRAGARPAAATLVHLVVAPLVAYGHIHVGWQAGLADYAAAPGSRLFWTGFNLWVYAAIAAATHGRLLRRRALEHAAETATLEATLSRARLELLQGRLDPEWVEAVLADVERLALADPERADELTSALGELLRLALARGDGPADPAAGEAAAAARAAVEALRAGDAPYSDVPDLEEAPWHRSAS